MRDLALRIALVVVLLTAAFLRLRGLDWDGYNHYHPDERYIAWVATSVEWPTDLETAFRPTESTFNPYYWPAGANSTGVVLEQDAPRRFAYGHLPLYLGVASTRFLEWIGPRIAPHLPSDWLFTQDILNAAGANEFRHITAAGRLLAALFDLGTVALTFALGKRLFNSSVGLLAAAFLALNVMHIQLAHFFTVDPFVTFFVVAALLSMVLAVEETVPRASGQEKGIRRRGAYLALAAVCTGLAVGTKFSAVLLLLPLALSAGLVSRPWGHLRRPMVGFLLSVGLGAAAFLAFFVTNPFAILDWSCTGTTAAINLGLIEIPKLRWGWCYLENVVAQGTMVRGLRDVPYVRQYAGTTPFLYYIEMQLRWGMGPLLGIVSFSGLAWAAVRAGRPIVKRLRWRERRLVWSGSDSLLSQLGGGGQLIVLAWVIPFFVTTGDLYVKFMRYLQPLIPCLMIYGAALTLRLHQARIRQMAIALLLATTGLHALAFVAIYNDVHPWITASRWIYENVPPRSVILNEAWDDPIPDNIEVGGQIRQRAEYLALEVNWLSGTEETDNQTKLNGNLERLALADYVVLSSNRNYGVIPRLPERYPLSSQYYPLLMDGRLGFEAVYAINRMPHLAGVFLKVDSFDWPDLTPPAEVATYFDSLFGPDWGRADESFTVYDQPLVIIFANRGRLTANEMAALFTD